MRTTLRTTLGTTHARLLASAVIVAATLWAMPRSRSGSRNDPPSGQASTPLDRYLQDAHKSAAPSGPSPGGSLFTPNGPLSDLVRDPRARQVHDIVTILVVESSTAESKGSTSSSRKSANNAGISSLYGKASARFAGLATTSGSSSLDGSGTTKRENTVTTRLSARVTEVLPNGNLVIEANRDVIVNSERQLVTVRGVVRPADLARDNTVRSDRLAEMELRINGKGVVNDAIRRPFFLYRLLLGLLPF